MQKVTPSLWFDNQAEQAANYYVSLFPNSKINSISYYTEAGPAEKGTVLTVDFELDGQAFNALNGGPNFKFTEAVSFVISCKDQAEVDKYWDTLINDGGEPHQCGWLKDKFGLSWQIVPEVMQKLITEADEEKRNRVMQAMMNMVKLDIDTLENA